MELNRIEELISELPTEQKTAILKLIDLKTEQDMKEVLRSIDALKESLKHLENSNNTKFEAQNSKFNMIFWALGIVITLIVALKILG